MGCLNPTNILTSSNHSGEQLQVYRLCDRTSKLCFPDFYSPSGWELPPLGNREGHVTSWETRSRKHNHLHRNAFCLHL
jgi:hypothetical protein